MTTEYSVQDRVLCRVDVDVSVIGEVLHEAREGAVPTWPAQRTGRSS